MKCTVVDGTTYTGIYAPDGSINVVLDDGTYTGVMHPCGAWRVTSAPADIYCGLHAPDGSLYAQTTFTGNGALVLEGLTPPVVPDTFSLRSVGTTSISIMSTGSGENCQVSPVRPADTGSNDLLVLVLSSPVPDRVITGWTKIGSKDHFGQGGCGLYIAPTSSSDPVLPNTGNSYGDADAAFIAAIKVATAVDVSASLVDSGGASSKAAPDLTPTSSTDRLFIAGFGWNRSAAVTSATASTGYSVAKWEVDPTSDNHVGIALVVGDSLLNQTTSITGPTLTVNQSPIWGAVSALLK